MAVDTPPVEFLPYYVPGKAEFTRCSLCGAIVIVADQEQHVEWHSRLWDTLSALVEAL